MRVDQRARRLKPRVDGSAGRGGNLAGGVSRRGLISSVTARLLERLFATLDRWRQRRLSSCEEKRQWRAVESHKVPVKDSLNVPKVRGVQLCVWGRPRNVSARPRLHFIICSQDQHHKASTTSTANFQSIHIEWPRRLQWSRHALAIW